MINNHKKLKRKKQFKDYEKKRNILRQWQKEQDNKKRAGLPLSRMPVNFPKSKKFTK